MSAQQARNGTAGRPGAAAGLIGLDWGTSALRGWLLSADGTVLDQRTGGDGIMSVPGGDFAATYHAFTAAWRTAWPDLPALAAGMIGSRQGWAEAPYMPCPAGFGDVVSGCISVGEKAGLRIVPGLSCQSADGMIDVMRGEETQIFGALEADAGDGLFILPGTHSKWARVENGRVVDFATYMTGELFAVLRGHSILGRMMAEGTPADDANSFDAGAAEGLAAGDELTHRLFGVRTRGLFGTLSNAAAPVFLSGLLVGAEVRAARGAGRTAAGAGAAVLIGDATLCRLYARVLEMVDVRTRIAGPGVTPRGLWRLARAAGIIGP